MLKALRIFKRIKLLEDVLAQACSALNALKVCESCGCVFVLNDENKWGKEIKGKPRCTHCAPKSKPKPKPRRRNAKAK